MKEKSVAKNYIYNLIYQILSVLITLITTPYLARTLGAEQTGVYGYTFSYVTFFVLLGTLGVTIYGQREIAYVHNEERKRSIVFWEIKIVHFISMLFSLIIYGAIFCIKGEYVVYFRIFLLEIIAYSFDITWFLQGLEEFKKIVLRNTIVRLISLFSIFLFIREPNDLWKYLIIFSVTDVLGYMTLWAYLPKYLVKVKFSELNISKRFVPMIVLFLPQIAVQIYTVLDKSMIGIILRDMKEVGYYEQAQRILKTALTAITSMGTVILSRMSIHVAKNEKDKVNEYLLKTLEFVFFLGIPMTFGICAISNNLIPWFLGEGYEPVAQILIIMSPIIIAIGLTNIIGAQYLVSLKRQKEYTISLIAGCITNIFLNLFLIYNFKACGAAIASVIAELVVLGIQYYYIKKDVKIYGILKNVIKYLISGILMLTTIEILSNYFGVTGILGTLIEIVIGIITYIGILLICKDNYIYDNLMEIKNKIKSKKITLKKGKKSSKLKDEI